MSYSFSPILIPILLAAIVSLFLAWYTWRNRQTAGALSFAALMLALFQWGSAYVFQAASNDLGIKVTVYSISFLGVVVTPVAWFVFALEYTGRRTWVTPGRIAALSIVPALTLIVIATNQAHSLFWTNQRMTPEGGLLLLESGNGAWFWIHAAYSYVLLLIGATLIVRALLRWPSQYRGQMIWILLSVAAPWLANIITVFKLLPILIDLTPIAFTVTGIGMAYSLFRHKLLDLAPIAREIVVNSMNDGMIVLDSNGRVIDLNPSAEKILGFAGERNIIGRLFSDLSTREMRIFYPGGAVVEAEQEVSLGEGEAKKWYEMRRSPLRDERDQLIGQVITAHDFTTRKRTERRLQESEALFRQIVENASDLIYRTDKDGVFTYANPSALRAMGFTEESQVIGRHYLDLTAPDARPGLKRAYEDQYANRTMNSYQEFPALTAEGQEIWLGQNVQLILREGEVVGFQAVARDITAIKQAQEALRIARDRALEASKAKSQLLAKVSHELRTPLGGVLGYAELLRDQAFGRLNEEQIRVLTEIVQSTNYLNTMVNELLDEAQVEANKVVLHRIMFSPGGLLQQIHSILSGAAHSKGLELFSTLDPNLQGEMYGDERRIRQIMTNLVANAIKFTKHGSIHVKVFSPDPEHWSIQVTDTGIGISKEHLQSIFEPFQQGDNAVTGDNRGIGLGLSITRQLVDLMNGRILVDSQVGKGTTFSVLLPIEKGSLWVSSDIGIQI